MARRLQLKSRAPESALDCSIRASNAGALVVEQGLAPTVGLENAARLMEKGR